MALPGGLYQQQLALQPGTIIQGQDGTQYIVQPAVLPHQGAAAPAAAQYTVGLPQVQMVGTDPHQVTAANTVSQYISARESTHISVGVVGWHCVQGVISGAVRIDTLVSIRLSICKIDMEISNNQ